MIKQIFIALSFLLFLNEYAVSQVFNEDVYKFSRTLGLIEAFYVDSVNKPELVEKAIVGMLKNLDPHSVYFSKDEVKKMNEPLQGNFEGVGIQFNIFHDTLLVVSPVSGGPSEKVGILAGDRIVKIDNELVAGIGLTNEMVFKYLKGKKGTKVILSIKRENVNEIIDFEVIRDKIPIFSLDAAYMVNKNTGYIKLNRFSATTMNEYNEAVNKLFEKKAKNLILDLSNNGGGYLNMAFELANEFLEQGQMVVYTEGLKNPRQEYKALKKANKRYGKVVIMIDEGSASASEIVSGALQDWDRAVVVGRRSFGKGLVQRQFNLPDFSMIRLTVAKYYTPTGRLIQKPYDKGVVAYHKDIIERYNHGELSNKDSIHFPDSLKYFTMKNKRVVYGGGGIMPDIFVPIDTNGYSNYHRDLNRKGALNHFALTYLDKNRKKIEKEFLKNKKDKYEGFQRFNKNFEINDEMLNDLVKFAEIDKKIKPNPKEFEISKENIKINLKAIIANNIWDRNEFYEVINLLDPIFRKAVEVIENEEIYRNILK